MDAQSLIAELATRGIRLIPNPPKLIAVPAAKLTDEDCEAIRRHKADLLALLAAQHKQAETARICRRCGYHMYDSERVFCPACKTRLNTDKPEAVLCQTSPAEQEEREIDLLARADGWMAPSPAQALVETCRRHRVALRIDPATGALVVGKAGAKGETRPWPSLLVAIETHLEAVASLVEGGWHLRADFPQGEVA